MNGQKKEQAAVERSGSAARTLKGQAAMEYLMTYGWAILVIVLVLAILAFYLPNLIQVPESCLFSQPGFSCDVKKPVIVADSDNQVRVIFRLDNQQGQAVNITRVLCTTAAVGDITKPDTTVSVPAIAPGGSREFEVSCYNTDGGVVLMTPNSNFKGTIAVWYNFQDEVSGAPERLATATLTGIVLAE